MSRACFGSNRMTRPSFWLPWRFARWREWPVWFRVVWPLELATIVGLAAWKLT